MDTCLICEINKKSQKRAKSSKPIRHMLSDYKKYHKELYYTASVLCQVLGYQCPMWRTQVQHWYNKLNLLASNKDNVGFIEDLETSVA